MKSQFVLMYVLYVASILAAPEGRATTRTSSSEASSPPPPPFKTCTRNLTLSMMEVDSPTFQHFEIEPTREFKYLQVSMKIDSCYSRPVFRGNRFLSGENIHVNQTAGGSLPLDVSYKKIAGKHGYSIRVLAATGVLFADDVDTAEKCGRCLGFKVKAVGANICTFVLSTDGEIQNRGQEAMQQVGLIDERVESRNGGQKAMQQVRLLDGGVENRKEGFVAKQQTRNGGHEEENRDLGHQQELQKSEGRRRQRLLSKGELVSSIRQLTFFVNWAFLGFLVSVMSLSFAMFLLGVCLRKTKYSKLPQQPAGTT
ncbi:uncharacterized protein LOC135214395 [Macrobrachium nipponense]|uniref:uncharacterized protein LOC135214395 n=1 Tax=Macrobrachium nipponense TaxID=159736 RepID=UPI0030C7C4B7